MVCSWLVSWSLHPHCRWGLTWSRCNPEWSLAQTRAGRREACAVPAALEQGRVRGSPRAPGTEVAPLAPDLVRSRPPPLPCPGLEREWAAEEKGAVDEGVTAHPSLSSPSCSHQVGR